MKRALVVVLCLASAPALAALRVVGFAKDSSAFAYLDQEEDWAAGPDAKSELVVRDLRTLEEKHFRVASDADPDGELDALSGEFRAWRKKSPWVRATPSRTSPDGKAELGVKTEASGDGAWSGGTWSAAGSSSWTITVTRGNDTRDVVSCAPADSLLAFWAPDGHRVVLMLVHNGTNMRDPGYQELLLGSDGVELVAIAAPTKAAGTALAGELSKAGFAVGNVSLAKKKRDAPVVYAAKDQQELARRIAALPALKGATVEALDWKSSWNVVVALPSK